MCIPIKSTLQSFKNLKLRKKQGKEMATHSSILASEIPRTEELGEAQPTGSQRAGHDLAPNQQQQRQEREDEVML